MLKIIPRKIGPITVYQVSPIDQCWVHRLGDTQLKNTTRNLANSTKMRKSFANFGHKPDPLDLCRVWHSPGWPCSRSWSCTGDLPWNSRQAPWWTSGRGGRRTGGRSRETRGRRENTQEQVRMPMTMDDMEWHTGRDSSHKCDVWTHVHLQTVRGVLRNCAMFASVCIVVFIAIVRNVLKVVEVVREDVRSLP